MRTDQAQSRPPAASYAAWMAGELKRIARRRSLPPEQAYRPWGLSLSGGGIRSATFCLGVLQALSRAPLPPGTAPLDFGTAAPEDKHREDKLLGQLDYLSTVSGGGYIGTFFASLFVPGRVTPNTTAGASAADAYDTLRDEAGRLRTGTINARTTTGAQKAMCWLRENGRYLAPSSGGDLLYGAATAVRAWVGLQLVLGLLLLLVLAPLNLAKQGLLLAAGHSKWTDFIVALAQPGAWHGAVWLSGLWLFPALLLAVCVVPCGCAYWMTYPPLKKDLNAVARQPAAYWATYLGCAAAVAAGLAVFTPGGLKATAWSQAQTPFAAVLLEMLAGAVWFLAVRGDLTFAKLRVRLTRQLTSLLKVVGVLAFLALVDTLAQSWYLHQQTVATPLTAAAVLTWLVRRAAPQIKNLQGGKRTRVPVEVLLSLAAAALAVLLIGVWDYGVLWLQWQDMPLLCSPKGAKCPPLQPVWVWLALLLLSAGILGGMMGQFPQFLNLSSLQNLYSARLTRAYQGASNHARFKGGDRTLSSAEAMDSDHISHAVYNSNPYAPLHIINVCLNQNVDPAEQLIQRDRKGRPLAILPAIETPPAAPPASAQNAGPPLPFAIDGKFGECDASAGYALTIGEWIGVSGAAAATGSGRRTSGAMALLLGLANVRLGRWWHSGTAGTPGKLLERCFRFLLPMQSYLVDELGAHFYGTRRPLHYLSDGGHFENTGLYELLRPERNLRFVIACDCGADPGYQFDDLANLIRLARIDFRVEIEVETSVTASTSQLREVFGTAEELAKRAPDSNKCAMLLHVFRTAAARQANQPDMKIVLIKPVLIAGAPLDVHNYGIANPDFPQQTTGDQFFDEAQWESYRKLGFEIGRRIFDSSNAAHHAELWTTLP